MADGITIDARINPYLDDAAFNKQMDRLDKEVRSLTRANYIGVQNRLTSFLDAVVKRGQADTHRAAAQWFADMTGGGYSSEERGFIRAAGVRAAGRAKQEKLTAQAAQKRADRKRARAESEELAVARAEDRTIEIEGLQARYDAYTKLFEDLQAKGGTRQDWALLSRNSLQLQRDGNKLSKEILKTEKQSPKELQKLNKSINTLVSETSRPGKIIGGAGGLLKGLGIAGGIATLLRGVFKSIQEFGAKALALGETAYARSMQAGLSSAEQGAGRFLAKEYGIKDEAIAGSQDYALDFTQRMRYGEVSQREWMALSQMGEYGQFIMRGGGTQDPQKAVELLRQYIQANATDKAGIARVRQQLRWIGQSPELLNMRAWELTQEEREQGQARYGALVGRELSDAQKKMAEERGLDPLKEGIGTWYNSLRYVAAGFSGESRRKIIESARAGGMSGAEMLKTYGPLYWNEIGKTEEGRQALANMLGRKMEEGGGASIGTQNNSITVNVSSVDQVDEATQGALRGIMTSVDRNAQLRQAKMFSDIQRR